MKLEHIIIVAVLISVIAAPPLAQAKTAQAKKTSQQISLENVVKITAEQKPNPELIAKEDPPVTKSEPIIQAPTPEPPQQVAVAPAVSVSGCEQYRSELNKYAWNINTALAICMAESGGNTMALSPTCDRGIMQVNCVHADMVGGDLSLLFDPSVNIRVAYSIYTGNGWAAWSTFNNGAYLRYL